MNKLTWTQLVEIEPRLADLLKEIKAVKDPGGPKFCANAVWFGSDPGDYGFREKLTNLAGWYAEKKEPALNSAEAYDLAYKKLYAVLPPCRNCNCL